MRIEWTDSMSVGNQVLDFQHRHLLYLVNSLILSLGQGNMREAEYAILEFLQLSELHVLEEQGMSPYLRQPFHTRHCDAHARIAQQLFDICPMAADGRMDAEALQLILDRTLVDNLIDLFGFDPDFRFRLLGPERRAVPRLTLTGFVADLGGVLAEVIDAFPTGLALRTGMPVTDRFVSLRLIPKIRDSVLVQDRFTVFGKPIRINSTTLLIELAKDSQTQVKEMFFRLYQKENSLKMAMGM